MPFFDEKVSWWLSASNSKIQNVIWLLTWLFVWLIDLIYPLFNTNQVTFTNFLCFQYGYSQITADMPHLISIYMLASTRLFTRKLLTFDLSTSLVVMTMTHLWPLHLLGCYDDDSPLTSPPPWLLWWWLTFDLSTSLVVMKMTHLWPLHLLGCYDDDSPLTSPPPWLLWQWLTFDLSTSLVVVTMTHLWPLHLLGC